jgi:polyribonucleotide nucleotidyltransferase
MINRVEAEIDGKRLIMEHGRVARQAGGAVLVQYGETIVLVSVVASEEPDYERGWLPLYVDYREKSYAAGKIPGGFFKREGRPGEQEILNARQVDRPLRPFFPDGYAHEVQVMATVLSYDQENEPGILCVIGASAALGVSDIPFPVTLGAVKVGLLDGRFVVNPSTEQLKESRLDISVVGTRDSIVMVEGSAAEVTEEEMLTALRTAREPISRIIELQDRLRSACGKPKRGYEPAPVAPGLEERVNAEAEHRVREAITISEREARRQALREIHDELCEKLAEEFPDSERSIAKFLGKIEKEAMREMILETGRRIDGRRADEIRPISCEVGVLPRTHGSALFTRGQTQALAVVTLGTASDEQRIDNIMEDSSKAFMLHYNFPPYSVGEIRPIRGPGRREIGHGALAERALRSVLPPDEEFPYTVRIVADILESNGSSSMATVCSGSLSLMDAGAPVRAAVAGIAMGLVKEGDRVAILTDILGDEDHLGDMDFKVTGTREGITAFQMDIKISEGISDEIMAEALQRARNARLQILDIMDQTISRPRAELSKYAPRILSLTIPRDRIGDVIGPGGKVIRGIIEQTGAKIDVDDDGTVVIASVDPEAGQQAFEMVQKIVEEPEVGKLYHGTVKNVQTFGAFVEILPKVEGLCHISELDYSRVRRVEDICNVGDEMWVKLIGIDNQGRIKLSRRAALDEMSPEKRPADVPVGGEGEQRPREERRGEPEARKESEGRKDRERSGRRRNRGGEGRNPRTDRKRR